MIALALTIVLALVLLAWTRDGLTFRQFGSWLCGRSQIVHLPGWTEGIDQHQHTDDALRDAIERSKARHPSQHPEDLP